MLTVVGKITWCPDRVFFEQSHAIPRLQNRWVCLASRREEKISNNHVCFDWCMCENKWLLRVWLFSFCNHRGIICFTVTFQWGIVVPPEISICFKFCAHFKSRLIPSAFDGQPREIRNQLERGLVLICPLNLSEDLYSSIFKLVGMTVSRFWVHTNCPFYCDAKGWTILGLHKWNFILFQTFLSLKVCFDIIAAKQQLPWSNQTSKQYNILYHLRIPLKYLSFKITRNI